MKKSLQFLFFLLLLSSFVFVSCKKDEAEPKMTAIVGGSDWSALVRTVTMSQTQNVLVITGFPTLSQTASQSIIITIRGTTEGTYSLTAYVDELSGQCMILYKTNDNATPGSAAYYNSYSATVTVSEIDSDKKKISGTFSADMYPNGDPMETKIVISEGNFENLSYTVIN